MTPIKTILTWWGKFRFMFQFLSFYLSIVSLTLSAVTAYNTTLRDWAILYLGFDLKLWLFGVIIVGFMLLGMVIEKYLTVPYLVGMGNKVAYESENPVREDLEAIHEEQAKAKSRDAEIAKKLDELLGRPR